MKYSILIVNYKTKNNVLLLLDDVYETFQNSEYEVIIVDNFSGDKFPDSLKNVHIIYHKENVGFGKGMNIASKYAKGKYLVLINPDCRIPGGQDFEHFVQEAMKMNFGVLAPLILYPNGNIQPNRGGRSTVFTFIFQNLKLGRFKYLVPGWASQLPLFRSSIVGKYLKNFQEKIPAFEKCEWVTGAFMVIPRHIYEKVKGFDENYFMYSEDEDLCIKIQNEGLISLFCSDFKIIHEVAGSQKEIGDSRLKFTEIKKLESSIYFTKKYYSNLSAFFLKMFYFFHYTLLAFFHNQKMKYLKSGWSLIKYRPK